MGRRRIRVVAVVVAAVTVPTLGYLHLLHGRPGLEAGEGYGVDVSHHQGAIDWLAVAADDITFAYLKATEGGDWTDRRFAENLAGATGAGLQVGAYHFFTNCTDGASQARHFLDVVPVGETPLPPALDLEHVTQCEGRLDRAELLAEVDAFIEVVETETAHPVVVYVLDGVEGPYRVLEELAAQPRWDRSLFRRPGDDGWAIWQVSNIAIVDGIEGGVDLDVVDPSELAATPPEQG